MRIILLTILITFAASQEVSTFEDSDQQRWGLVGQEIYKIGDKLDFQKVKDSLLAMKNTIGSELDKEDATFQKYQAIYDRMNKLFQVKWNTAKVDGVKLEKNIEELEPYKEELSQRLQEKNNLLEKNENDIKSAQEDVTKVKKRTKAEIDELHDAIREIDDHIQIIDTHVHSMNEQSFMEIQGKLQKFSSKLAEDLKDLIEEDDQIYVMLQGLKEVDDSTYKFKKMDAFQQSSKVLNQLRQSFYDAIIDRFHEKEKTEAQFQERITTINQDSQAQTELKAGYLTEYDSTINTLKVIDDFKTDRQKDMTEYDEQVQFMKDIWTQHVTTAQRLRSRLLSKVDSIDKSLKQLKNTEPEYEISPV